MDDGRLDLMPRDRGTLEMLLRHARESTASLLAEEPSIKKSGKPPSPLFLRTVLEAIANEKLELAFYRKELPVFLKATATGDTPKLTVACICGRQCVTDDTA